MPQRPLQGPIPVAFITDLLSVGGAEAQLVALTRALDPARVRCEVAVLRSDDAVVDALTVPFTLFGMHSALNGRTLPALAAWLRRGGFRAIYTTHIWSVVFSAILKEWLRPPAPQRRYALIASEHSYGMPTASRKVLITARRWALRRADAIVALGEGQAGWLREYYGPKAGPIEVIPNGIDPAHFRDLPSGAAAREEFAVPPGAAVILAIARMVALKNLDVLIQTMGRPELEGSGAHLILVGDGPERAVLMEKARASRAGGRIHFAGARADVRPFLAAADLVCLPSRFEAQPIVILEAMAAGLPVVASRVGGIPEMIAEEESGLLVDPGDPAGLAQALARALADPAWRRAAGEAGRKKIEGVFSIHTRARRMEEMIARLVEEARR